MVSMPLPTCKIECSNNLYKIERFENRRRAVISIGVGDGGGAGAGEEGTGPPPLEIINSGKLENIWAHVKLIIRALNLGEDLFLETTLIL